MAADIQPGEAGKPWCSGIGWALRLQLGGPDCGTLLRKGWTVLIGDQNCSLYNITGGLVTGVSHFLK